jgi:hypothetical protein
MKTPETRYTSSGPPYAVINLSKIGLRYFRLCIKATQSSKDKLIDEFVNHPNIGWIFSAKGWFNIAIGIWASDNDEINDISTSIRSMLSPKDRIVYQSELTALYGFGTSRPITGKSKEMRIIDSKIKPLDLDPLSIDFLKILTIDSSLSKKEYSEVLGATISKIDKLNKKLISSGIVVGDQERVNYVDKYFKVFIDSKSRLNKVDVYDFIDTLWKDSKCIYFEKANGKYDIEFEVILKNSSTLKRKYLKNFSDYKFVELKHIYTNLYPLNKIANFKHIKEAITGQKGKVVDLRNSKLWYLNYEGVGAYLKIFNNKKYMELMEKSEIELYGKVASFIKKETPGCIYHVIDLGSGNGLKGKMLIDKLGERIVKAYYPVDIQPIELSYTIDVHKEASYATHPTLLDFEKINSMFPIKTLPKERQVYAFLGGTYGNFPTHQINSYLRSLYEDKTSVLVICMPLMTSKKKIMDSYENADIETMAFGPLKHIGFKKSDFKPNKDHPGLIVHIGMESSTVISSFVLNRNVALMGRKFKAGTVFKMTSSWKPTLKEFEYSLQKDFKIRKIFHNKAFAIAVCQK